MKKLLLVVFLISFGLPALAQQAIAPQVDGIKFLSPVTIAAGSDNNFLVDRTDPNEKLLVLSLAPSIQPGAPDIRPRLLNDKFFLLRAPKMAYVNDSRRHEFLIDWVPEFEIYKNNSDLNGMNQQAMASFNYYLKRNLQVWIGDNFETSKDPARSLSNVFLLLPRSRYRSNQIHGTIEYQPSARTNLSVQYDNAYTLFGGTDPFQTRLLDSRSDGYAFTFTRLLGHHDRISARYSLYKIRPVNHQKRFDDAVDTDRPFERPIHGLTLTYRANPTTSFNYGFSGGVIKLYDGANYTLSASLRRRFGYFWAGGSYTRALVFQTANTNGFATGLASNGFYEVVNLQLQGQPTRRTGLLLETTMSRAASNQVVEANKSLMGRARLDYRINDRTVWFANWDTFQQTRNAFVQSPLSRNRVTIGIEFSLASESERRLDPLNEDTQYVALTDHGRRRRAPEED